jgi:hypothetical protein
MLNLPPFLIGSNLVFEQFFDFLSEIKSIIAIVEFNLIQAIGCNFLDLFFSNLIFKNFSHNNPANIKIEFSKR